MRVTVAVVVLNEVVTLVEVKLSVIEVVVETVVINVVDSVKGMTVVAGVTVTLKNELQSSKGSLDGRSVFDNASQRGRFSQVFNS
jgi:hypothetical protein